MAPAGGERRQPRPGRNALRAGALIAVATLALFLLGEGAAATTYFAHTLLIRPNATMPTEERHAEYDSLLGWTNRPDLLLPDLYGAGIWFQSNGQRLRADRDYGHEVPSGRVRVVCSGDSFTMGYSVSNDEAWCRLLELRDSRLETVNLAVSGYGLDQAWLRYRRDGTAFTHDVHLFAFITDDFSRMLTSSFLGYPKPFLRLAGDSLIVGNVPVPPKPSFFRARARLRDATDHLNSIRLARAVLRRLGLWERQPIDRQVIGEEDLRPIVAAVLADLRRLAAERGSIPVLVYLPQLHDGRDSYADRWRAFVSAEAMRQGMPLLDLVAGLRDIPVVRSDSLFERTLGHYNADGNRWVADRVLEGLAGLPAVQQRIRDRREAPGQPDPP